jgi:hypothetical protein
MQMAERKGYYRWNKKIRLLGIVLETVFKYGQQIPKHAFAVRPGVAEHDHALFVVVVPIWRRQ